jgi:hypothetical protein
MTCASIDWSLVTQNGQLSGRKGWRKTDPAGGPSGIACCNPLILIVFSKFGDWS